MKGKRVWWQRVLKLFKEIRWWQLGLAIAVGLGIGAGLMFQVDFQPRQWWLTKTQPSPSQATVTAGILPDEVMPQAGYRVAIRWGEVGKKLVAAGGIDLAKYRKNYQGEREQELLTYLTSEKEEGITINSENAYFWVNTLWALGLTQKSDVLDKGVMGADRSKLGNYASTGGWTLGAKDAVALFSSAEIIPLTSEQNQMVKQISDGIYRPCCGNPTSFPDCNHGMAILGLVELMVSQGFSEEEIYQAALKFNSYWFGDTYIDLAYYFRTKEGKTWDQVDPKVVLSAQYSSGQGYAAIKKQIGTIPGKPQRGGSCGA